MMELRLGHEEDFEFFLEIDRISCEREGTEWNPEHRGPLITTFTRNERNLSVVASSEDKVIAAILLRQRNTSDTDLPEYTRQIVVPHFGHGTEFVDIFDIWVDPSWRRRGIARLLKLKAEEECRRRGVQWIFTFQHPNNSAAIALNERLGYEHIGTARMWDDVDRVCFKRKTLDA